MDVGPGGKIMWSLRIPATLQTELNRNGRWRKSVWRLHGRGIPPFHISLQEHPSPTPDDNGGCKLHKSICDNFGMQSDGKPQQRHL